MVHRDIRSIYTFSSNFPFFIAFISNFLCILSLPYVIFVFSFRFEFSSFRTLNDDEDDADDDDAEEDVEKSMNFCIEQTVKSMKILKNNKEIVYILCIVPRLSRDRGK